MAENIVIFVGSLYLVIKGATLSTRYSAKLAEQFNLSKYVVGFIIIAFISILPESLISISSAVEGVPEFGLGTLFGSNIADLTLIFAILIMFAGRGIKIEGRILKNTRLYPLFILLPLVFGLNGHYSRIEGLILILSGGLFYYLVFRSAIDTATTPRNENDKYRNILGLLFSMAILLIGSRFTVTSAVVIADHLRITPILIGMIIVGLGTTMPELFYSLKAVRGNDDGLAMGDILGTVLADSTLVVGVLACISPFYFPTRIIYLTGGFMLVGSLILLRLMKSGRTITKKEGAVLFIFWAIYALVEIMVNRYQVL